MDVLHLEGHVLPLAIGAASVPFLKKILPDLIAEERALLILGAGYFWIFYLLHIKADCFNGYGGKRGMPDKFIAPALHIFYA
jgi:hypothetical protein